MILIFKDFEKVYHFIKQATSPMLKDNDLYVYNGEDEGSVCIGYSSEDENEMILCTIFKDNSVCVSIKTKYSPLLDLRYGNIKAFLLTFDIEYVSKYIITHNNISQEKIISIMNSINRDKLYDSK